MMTFGYCDDHNHRTRASNLEWEVSEKNSIQRGTVPVLVMINASLTLGMAIVYH